LACGWSRIAAVIVTCPSCAARYRLSESALAKPARLKCAACGHRWIPVAEVEPATLVRPPPHAPLSEADEDAAMRAVQEQIRARWQDAATPVAPPSPGDITEELTEPPPAAEALAEPEAAPPPPSTWLRNLVALIFGTALAIAAAGLWVGRQDPAQIPMVGEMMTRIAPPASVEITVSGTTSGVSSGYLVLEVNGLIINRGKTSVSVPPLEATLAGPEGTALRWTIPPPRRRLGPNQQVAFTSTVTGFPESATQLHARAVQ
jgi:predicted Zn finger-like uncharacterized protein